MVTHIHTLIFSTVSGAYRADIYSDGSVRLRYDSNKGFKRLGFSKIKVTHAKVYGVDLVTDAHDGFIWETASKESIKQGLNYLIQKNIINKYYLSNFKNMGK